jgi:hypothetical protein
MVALAVRTGWRFPNAPLGTYVGAGTDVHVLVAVLALPCGCGDG